MSKAVWVVFLGVVLAAGVAIWYLQRAEPMGPEAVLAPPVEAPGAAPSAAAGAEIQYPLPDTANAAVPLPTLEDSDADLRAALINAFGAAPIESVLIPERIVRRVVVTVISLDGAPVPLRLRPLRHTPGPFVVETRDERFFLDPRNAERYRPLIALLQAADMKTLAALYVRYYPLFQKAYVDLGYPDRYFNDRLIEVLNHLLETREVAGPIELVRPKVLYEFADRELEKRSSGEKILIRIGAENAEVVRGKLLEFREALVAETARK